MKNLSMATNNKTMSSLEIAELTGKEHKQVLRDIRNMANELYPNIQGTDLYLSDLQGFIVEKLDNGFTKQVLLDYSHTQTLITGYSITLRKKVIDRWQELEEKQIDPMKALAHE